MSLLILFTLFAAIAVITLIVAVRARRDKRALSAHRPSATELPEAPVDPEKYAQILRDAEWCRQQACNFRPYDTDQSQMYLRMHDNLLALVERDKRESQRPKN